MVNNCAVSGCKNNSCKNKNLSFFEFPKNEYYKNAWLKVCRSSVTSLRYARICSEHFRPECFKKTSASLKYVSDTLKTPIKRLKRLVPNSIPTENLVQISQIKREISEFLSASIDLDEELNLGLVIKTNVENSDDEDSNILPSLPDIKLLTTEEGKLEYTLQVLKFRDEMNEKLKKEIEKRKEKDEECDKLRRELENKEKENEELNENLNKQKEESMKSEKIREEKKVECEGYISEISTLKKSEAKLRRKCSIYFTRMKYAENDLNHVKNKHDEMIGHLRKVFTPGQMQMLLHPKKQARWTSEDIESAITLRATSVEAYEYLRKVVKFPLPGESSLRRRMEKSDVEPGVLDDVSKVVTNNEQDLSINGKLT